MNIPKFRAWIKAKKEMHDVLLIDWLNGLVDLAYSNIELDFNDVILMQSTGLKDINGVEIFEGDIVIDTAGPQIKMIVKWIDDCSGFRTVGKYNGDSYIGYVGHINKLGNNTCEILGNIYENKELLED